jgi:predicted Zn-dependent peptidase
VGLRALALDALGGLTISRLHRRLVRGEELSTGLSASAMSLARGASLGFIGVDVADGVSTEQVEDAVCEELTRFATQGPTPVELEAALADTERSWLEALAAQDERANLISHYTLLHDDPDYVNTYLDLVAEIGAEDVRRAAGTWLQPASRVTVAYLRDAALTEGAA